MKQEAKTNTYNRLRYKQTLVDKRCIALLNRLKEFTRMPTTQLVTAILAAAGFSTLERNDVIFPEYVQIVKNAIRLIDPDTDKLIKTITKTIEDEIKQNQ